MTHPRSAKDLLAFLTAHEHQLESDRDRVKQLVIAKVDSEFDVLLAQVRAHKVQIEIMIRNQALNDSTTIETDHVDNNDNLDDDQALQPSTSTNRRGQKRKRIGGNETISRKRVGASRHVCIYPGCGKEFSFDSDLFKHERTHTGVRPYSCAWRNCQYDAAQRNDVVSHVRIVHLKLPRYQKDQLALNITERRDPNRWVRVNQDLASQRLTKANITFFNKSSKVDKPRILKKNSNNVGKYVCRSHDCGRTFKTSSDRLQHERAIHMKAKPYGCTWPDCGFVSSRRSQVVSHVRMVHFGLPQTKKLQRQMSITDDRDPNQWVRFNQDQASRRVE